LYLNNDKDSLQHFNEYLEVRTPLVLYYSSHHKDIETYKDALSMAFRIPMTTDFDMISDWFIEYENEENRKRLRVDTEYRSVELETIREVITKGLSLLNNESENHFTELQTEIDETVKDGQVASWLSIKKDGKRLNVKQLSDGEKRVLILLIDITRRLITVGKTNNETDFFNGFGIVLIDEIEQHLHPKWQRMLLPTLNKLFPNLQFIVTTHSPQVLSYVPNGCAYSLEEGKAFPENTYGRNNEWILEAIMDDVSRPVEVKAKLDEYFDAIRDNKMDKATQLRGGLETLIGADEPELLKADILIRRKQKSVAKNEDNS
jgi:predicted ATP-binding protein involved in virulence